MNNVINENSLVSGLTLAIGNSSLGSLFNTISKDVVPQNFSKPGVFVIDISDTDSKTLYDGLIETHLIDIRVFVEDESTMYNFMRKCHLVFRDVFDTIDLVDTDLNSIGKANLYRYEWNITDNIGHFLLTYKYKVINTKSVLISGTKINEITTTVKSRT